MSRCSNEACGLVWMNPMPVEQDIWKAYARYYTHTPPASRSLLSRLLFTLLGLEKDREQLELYCLAGERPGRLLELGFGHPRRLQRLKSLGWQVEGQEVDPVAIDQAHRLGLTAHQGLLQDLELEEGGYDVIVSSHVIEHVHEAEAMLEGCRRLLRPGGKIVFLTPNVEGYGHWRFGRAWRGLEPPRHLYLYSPVTLRALAERAGFARPVIKTTAARSAVMYQECLALEDAERGRASSESRARYLRVAGHVAAARLGSLLGLVQADEMMLTAWRDRD